MKSFSEYVKTEAINEGVEIQDKKFGSKKTKYIELSQEEFDKVSKDFTNTNKNIWMGKTYKSGGYSWKMAFAEYDGKYQGYGVSGDSSFGRSPAYMKVALSGNVRVAKDVFTQFIKEYSL